MLKSTFCHVPGISGEDEEEIWDSGIKNWDALLRSESRSRNKSELYKHIEDSIDSLEKGDLSYFWWQMPSLHHWRLFPEFRESIAYLDIETTGLYKSDDITTIAVYDGNGVHTYVKDRNLSQFKKDIMKYKLLVTYNGRCFDVPFIQRKFKMKLKKPHIDLRYVLARLGYKGGQKGCEKLSGISRGKLRDVDGYMAVLLWNEYKKGRNLKALETLLAYNSQDAINLEMLLIQAYNDNLAETPFHRTHKIKRPANKNMNPFEADSKTLDKFRRYILSHN